MKIGYRRLNGSIGLSDREPGTRGTWLEKRQALIAALLDRGHENCFYSPPSKASADYFSVDTTPCEVLFIEFAAHNLRGAVKGVVETFHFLMRHEGKVIFVTDDPDLPFPFSLAPSDARFVLDADPTVPLVPRGEHYWLDLDFSKWEVWLNTPLAERIRDCGYTHWEHIPSDVTLRDAPFASLLDFREPRKGEWGNKLVYLGRPSGRKAILSQVLPTGTVNVYGKPDEWIEDFPGVTVSPCPSQVDRRDFYSRQVGCLGIADRKHISLGWRTGRLYHALAAGSPGIIQDTHSALTSTFVGFSDAQDLRQIHVQLLDPEVRKALVEASLSEIQREKNGFARFWILFDMPKYKDSRHWRVTSLTGNRRRDLGHPFRN